MEEVVGLAPSGSMGSGYNLDAFKRGVNFKPHFIGQDAGSTDMGPYYHGTGNTFLPLATIGFERGFVRPGHAVGVQRKTDSGQDDQNAHHDQHLDQREASRA